MKPHKDTFIWMGYGAIAFILFAIFSQCITTQWLVSADMYLLPLTIHHTIAYAALFFTYLANAEIILLVAFVTVIIFIVFKKKYLAALSLFGLFVGSSSSYFLKNIFERARPTDFLYVIPRSGYAFPSGHALIAMVFYGFIGYCLSEAFHKKSHKIIVAVCTGFLVFAIGYSRVILGFHWPSDVLGGWILGFGLLCVLITGYKYAHVTWRKRELPHGISVGLVVFLIVLMGFWVMAFYVTHPLIMRSTIVS